MSKLVCRKEPELNRIKGSTVRGEMCDDAVEKAALHYLNIHNVPDKSQSHYKLSAVYSQIDCDV